jgi:hypothetical protein
VRRADRQGAHMQPFVYRSAYKLAEIAGLQISSRGAVASVKDPQKRLHGTCRNVHLLRIMTDDLVYRVCIIGMAWSPSR